MTIIYLLFFARLIGLEKKTWKYTNILQCLSTTITILAQPRYYFVVSSYKCEGKSSTNIDSCHDLIPNPFIITTLGLIVY